MIWLLIDWLIASEESQRPDLSSKFVAPLQLTSDLQQSQLIGEDLAVEASPQWRRATVCSSVHAHHWRHF